MWMMDVGWWDNDVYAMIYECFGNDELLMGGCIDLILQW